MKNWLGDKRGELGGLLPISPLRNVGGGALQVAQDSLLGSGSI